MYKRGQLSKLRPYALDFPLIYRRLARLQFPGGEFRLF